MMWRLETNYVRLPGEPLVMINWLIEGDRVILGWVTRMKRPRGMR